MRKPYDYYDGPHVMNELRNSHACKYARRGRVADLKHLNFWGDSRYRETNSWKDNRKAQYRTGGRGKRNELELTDNCWRKEWNLEKYFKANDIPFCIEQIKESRQGEYVIYAERVKTYQVPKYCYTWEFITQSDGKKKFGRVVKHQIGFEWRFIEVPLDKPKVIHYNRSVSIGSRVIWWSDKDIGIDHILKRIHW